MKTVSRAEITDLQQIPNIGPSIAANLRRIGVSSPHELLGILVDCCTTVDEMIHNIALHAVSTRVKLVPSSEVL